MFSNVALVNAAAMALSSSCLSALVHPFDVVRTRRQAIIRQTYVANQMHGQEGQQESHYIKSVTYRSVYDTIYSENGVAGFYKGWLLVGVATFTSYFLFVGLYEFLINNYQNVPKVMINVGLAVCLQAVVQPLWTPISKISACNTVPELNGIDQYWFWKSIRIIVQKQGITALWDGILFSTILSLSHVQYTVYSVVRDFFTTHLTTTGFATSMIVVVIAVCFAQAAMTAVMTPLITLMTERMVRSRKETCSAPRSNLTSVEKYKWVFTGFAMSVSKSLTNKLLKYGLFELFRTLIAHRQLQRASGGVPETSTITATNTSIHDDQWYESHQLKYAPTMEPVDEVLSTLFIEAFEASILSSQSTA